MSDSYSLDSNALINRYNFIICGLNDHCQLGKKIGEINDDGKLIIYPPNYHQLYVASYSAYENHSVAITKDGIAYALGDNTHHQIIRSLPKQEFQKLTKFEIKDDDNRVWYPISAVCGGYYTLYLVSATQKSGQTHLAYSCKDVNLNYPLFLSIGRSNPISIFGGEFNAAAIDDEGSVIFIPFSLFAFPFDEIETSRLPDDEKCVCVACCYDFVVALGMSGRVFVSKIPKKGNKLNFVLVNFLKDKKIIEIHGTCYHCFAVSENGKVYGCGSNENGQLGIGKQTINDQNFREISSLSKYRILKAYAGSSHSLFQTENGKIISCGTNKCGELITGRLNKTDISLPLESLIKENATFCVAGDCFSAVFFRTDPEKSPNRRIPNKIFSKTHEFSSPLLTPEKDKESPKFSQTNANKDSQAEEKQPNKVEKVGTIKKSEEEVTHPNTNEEEIERLTARIIKSEEEIFHLKEAEKAALRKADENKRLKETEKIARIRAEEKISRLKEAEKAARIKAEERISCLKSEMQKERNKSENEISDLKSEVARLKKENESLRLKFQASEMKLQTETNRMKEREQSILNENSEIQNINTTLNKKIKSLNESLDELKIKLKQETDKNRKIETESNGFKILDQTLIDKMRQVEDLGKGTQSKVVKVIREEELALKIVILSPNPTQKNSNSIGKTNFLNVKRFLLEYEILKELNHPNIIKSYGFCYGDKNHPPSILLELCTENLVQRVESLEEMDQVCAIYEICIAMEAVHAENIIHRDLKPENILFDENDHVRVCDFGISCIIDSKTQTRTNVISSLKFMAPELINERTDYNNKVDVYSFGVIMYYILMNGEMPQIEIGEIATGKKAKIPESINEISRDIISKCWSTNPEDRPSFSEIANIIRDNNFELADAICPNSIKRFLNILK